MLSQNIKQRRERLCLTQQELADRLHVVRQTVSKWEKGISVPDCDLLVRLAEELGCTSAELLGETTPVFEANESLQKLQQQKEDAEQLLKRVEDLSAQLAEVNEAYAAAKRRRIGRRRILAAVVLIVCLALGIGSAAAQHHQQQLMAESIGIIGGADGPTAIFVAASPINMWFILFVTAAAAAVCVVYLVKTVDYSKLAKWLRKTK
ncbi:MAG: helix-turn-helix domain-containing protein [Oscillospiraceae bacterium]|nr:helix-turn-helix domain-containing protein [Oscillospiraceae bacterium]